MNSTGRQPRSLPQASPFAFGHGWSRGTVALVLALVVAAWFAYQPSLHGGWIWDDRFDVLDNRILRDPAALRRIWFEVGLMPDYYPIKATVQWIQWQLWGAAPTGYHVTNIVLHLASALMFWHVLSKLGVRHGWVGAMLFAVHPANVESVAWIAELKNTLSLPPLLLSLSQFLDYERTGRRRHYAGALAAFLAAMLTKTSVVMFPVALSLLWWWRGRRLDRRCVRVLAPFFAISLALGVVTLWLQETRAIADAAITLGSPLERLLRAGGIVAFYFRLIVWPANLMPLYPPAAVAGVPFAIATWVAIAALIVCCCRRRATWGAPVLVGFGWFGIHLLPFAGVTAIYFFRFTWVMDHFVYVPMLGLLGLAAAGTDRVVAALPALAARGWLASVLVLALGLAASSRQHSRAYADEKSLWLAAVQKNPQAWVAHGNLAQALVAAGDWPAARRHFETALALRPDFIDARNNFGNALLQRGDIAGAEVQFCAAIATAPRRATAHNNLGVARREAGRIAEAVPCFETALRLRADYPEALNNLANCLRDLGRPAEAVPHYERATHLVPEFAEAHFNLALALHECGRAGEARERYLTARRLRPSLPNLGW